MSSSETRIVCFCQPPLKLREAEAWGLWGCLGLRADVRRAAVEFPQRASGRPVVATARRYLPPQQPQFCRAEPRNFAVRRRWTAVAADRFAHAKRPRMRRFRLLCKRPCCRAARPPHAAAARPRAATAVSDTRGLRWAAKRPPCAAPERNRPRRPPPTPFFRRSPPLLSHRACTRPRPATRKAHPWRREPAEQSLATSPTRATRSPRSPARSRSSRSARPTMSTRGTPRTPRPSPST